MERLGFTFTVDDRAEVYNSCSFVYNGEILVFGGWEDKQQVSRVVGCRLERVGSLPFLYRRPACASFSEHGPDFGLICFDYDGTHSLNSWEKYRTCYKYVTCM